MVAAQPLSATPASILDHLGHYPLSAGDLIYLNNAVPNGDQVQLAAPDGSYHFGNLVIKKGICAAAWSLSWDSYLGTASTAPGGAIGMFSTRRVYSEAEWRTGTVGDPFGIEGNKSVQASSFSFQAGGGPNANYIQVNDTSLTYPPVIAPNSAFNFRAAGWFHNRVDFQADGHVEYRVSALSGETFSITAQVAHTAALPFQIGIAGYTSAAVEPLLIRDMRLDITSATNCGLTSEAEAQTKIDETCGSVKSCGSAPEFLICASEVIASLDAAGAVSEDSSGNLQRDLEQYSAFCDGHTAGYLSGHTAGYAAGEINGYTRGLKDGQESAPPALPDCRDLLHQKHRKVLFQPCVITPSWKWLREYFWRFW